MIWGSHPRRPAAAAIAVAATLSVGLPAAAQSGPQLGDDRQSEDGAIEVDFTAEERVVNETIDAWQGEPSPNVLIGLRRIGWTTDGTNAGLCVALEWRSVPREDADAIRADDLERWYALPYVEERVAEGADPDLRCPVDPAAALPPELIEQELTATLRDQLPRPELELPPGFALAGLRTYLLTGHDLDHQPPPFELDLGPMQLTVELTATGSTTVDWGDGTTTTHDTGATHGHPDGPINHVYTHTGEVTITATDTWDVSYQAGPVSGQITGLTLTPATLDIEVTERRAVRTR